jgi:hypothetical protein
MLVLASILLGSTAWSSAPSCPVAFSVVNTTVGAISSSYQLNLCVSKATFIKGTNGSLTLVVGNQVSTAPRCLVYPNGLSLDLTFSLLSSGHVGCWSLYPPGQAMAIVNVGKPSQVTLRSALRSFRPEMPRIFYRPTKGMEVGDSVFFQSSAKAQTLKTKLLTLPAQIRFKPLRYRWTVIEGLQTTKRSSLAKPVFAPTSAGIAKASLTVSYSVEYLFTGLTSWTLVKPDLVVNAYPVSFEVGNIEPPVPKIGPPRLVSSACLFGSSDWRC